MRSPERLDIHKQQILENQNAKLFFGNTIHFNKNEFLNYFFDKFNTKHINLSKGNVTNSLLKIGCFIDSESVVFNKFSALEINCFDESYKYLADYEFFCRMGEKFTVRSLCR